MTDINNNINNINNNNYNNNKKMVGKRQENGGKTVEKCRSIK